MKSISRAPHMGALEAYWQLSRPRTCLVSVLAYVFGMEVTNGVWSTRPAIGIAVTILVPAIANLHNAFTDVVEDEENLPGRARLVRAAKPERLRATVILGLFIIVSAGSYMGLSQLIFAATGSLLLIAYSAPPIRAKARPILGLLVFSLVIAFPFLAGTSVTDSWLEWRNPWTFSTVCWLVCLIVFFVAKGLVKNVPDFHGDKSAGLRTSATVMNSPVQAALLAVGGTWFAYALIPVTIFVTDSPVRMYLVVPWIMVACWHVTRLLRSESPAYLNTVLKWDMVVTVVTLSLLAVTPRVSMVAWAAVGGCALILLAADIIRRDSRAPIHLSKIDGQREGR